MAFHAPLPTPLTNDKDDFSCSDRVNGFEIDHDLICANFISQPPLSL